MRNLDSARILTPRREEEIYPYRRVWRSIVIENGVLAILTVALFVAYSILGITLPEQWNRLIGILLAVLPAILWLVFSYRPERQTPEPREYLLAVFIISMLVANAIGIPFIEDTLQVDRWLPLSSAVSRIIGYTFTVGVVQESLKYLIVRYFVWPDFFRNRFDSIAYCVASAVGYATVVNLVFAVNNVAPPDALMLRFFTIVVMHTVSSVVVAYGMTETLFNHAFPVVMPFALAFAALVTGISLPLRSGLMNAGLDITVIATRPYLSLGFSLALLIFPLLVMSFLFDLADRREREAATGREV